MEDQVEKQVVNQPVNNTLSSQPSKDVSVEKSFKIEEEEAAKPKLTETRKVKLPAQWQMANTANMPS